MLDNTLKFPAEVILDHTTDGIYVVDPDCRIVYWNKPAERITGWTAEQVLGRRCKDDILVHVDRSGVPLCQPGRCPLHLAMASRQPASAPVLVWAQTSRGDRVPVSVTVAPLLDKDGRAMGGVEVFRDETETVLNMERARLVQAHALAGELPQGEVAFHALYQPQDVVGGDYYRVQTLADGRHAFLLADVTGHGVAAALYTMTLHALWRDLTPSLDQPGQFMSRLNQSLESLTVGDSFVTACMGLADPISGRVTYASAGHPPAFLRSPRGEVATLETLDLALGMLPGLEFRQETAQLERGGMLLLCSDGALEAHSPHGEEFGQERLSGLLAAGDPAQPQALLESMRQALLTHVESVSLQDDLALLALCRAAEAGGRG